MVLYVSRLYLATEKVIPASKLVTNSSFTR